MSTGYDGNVVTQTITTYYPDYADDGLADSRVGLKVMTNDATDATTGDTLSGIEIYQLVEMIRTEENLRWL
jgi:hypothetical protein